MSKDINFNPGTTLPSQYLNEDQEGDTGLVWGVSLTQTTSDKVTLNIPTVGDPQASVVIGGKKRWIQSAHVLATPVAGAAGGRNILLVGAPSPATGITLEVLPTGVSSSAPLSRQIATAEFDGNVTLSKIRLRHGVQAEADQYNSFVFRSIATGTGETPVAIQGYIGQANDNTNLFVIGAGDTLIHRLAVTGAGRIASTPASPAATILSAQATASANASFTLTAAGAMAFGPGTAATDTVLARTDVGVLSLTGTFATNTVKAVSGGVVAISDHLNLAAGKQYRIGGTQIATADLGDSALLARLADPAFTGVPTAPTAGVDVNTTQLATTAYVVNQGYLKSATAATTYAALAGPTFTGNPTAPTQAVDNNSTRLATTAYVMGQGYAKLVSPAFTGTPSLPTGTTGITQSPGDNTMKLATTEFVTAGLALKANLNGPTFTGIPRADTAANGTSTTQLATTAFVLNNITAASVGDSTTASKGAVLMSVAPAVAASPTAVGTNDPRVVGGQAAGTASIRTLGTGATDAAAGNDSRLTNARTPTSHAATHKLGGSDPIRLDEFALPTAAVSFNSQKATLVASGTVPTDAVNKGQLDLKANIADQTFTGVPRADTAAPGTSTTQLATTAFVAAAIVASDEVDATTAVSGVTRLSAAPAVAAVPIAVGTNDARVTADQAAGTASIRTLGTGATQAAAGNDGRFTDARTPTAHAASHKAGGSDVIRLDELAAPTADVSLNGFKLTSLLAGVAGTDAVNKTQLDTKASHTGQTYTGTHTYTNGATFNSAVAINAALTVTTGGFASVLGGSDFSLTNTNATAYLSSNGLAFGPAGGSGSVDWTLTRTVGVANVAVLGTNDVIRDTRSAATILADTGSTQDLVPRTYVDTEIAKVGTQTSTISATGNLSTYYNTFFCSPSATPGTTITATLLVGLSAASHAGKTITFKDVTGNAGVSNVIIDFYGDERGDGATTYTLNTAYEWVTFQSNGTNWFVVG